MAENDAPGGGRKPIARPPNGEKRCTATNRAGVRCRRWAAKGCSVCRMHGAGSKQRPGGRPPTHGAFSKRCASNLKEAIQKYRTDPDLKNLDQDIARFRALLDRAETMLTSEEERLAAAEEKSAARGKPMGVRAVAAGYRNLMTLDGYVADLTTQVAGTVERFHRMVHGQKLQVLTWDYLDRVLKVTDDTLGRVLDPETAAKVRDALNAAFGDIPLPETNDLGK